nr:protein kinase-like domain-containing protein [Tanacetum cinerariifolium]
GVVTLVFAITDSSIDDDVILEGKVIDGVKPPLPLDLEIKGSTTDGRPRERFNESSFQHVTVCLLGTQQRNAREYKLPIAYKVAALVPSDSNPIDCRDVIVKERGTDDVIILKPYEESSSQVPEGSGNPNPTASAFNPLADQIETLTVESPIPTVSSPVPTACLNDSSEPSSKARLVSKREPSSKARLVSKRVVIQEETPSLDNIILLTNRFNDILRVSTSSDEIIGVEANVSNMETSISASPTPTLRIYKDHPKSQIIGPVDPPIQNRHKSKMVKEQKPKKVTDALQDPSWVEAMREELLQFKI